MAEQSVLVLGGGVGGLVASVETKRRLGKRAKVTLIDRKKDFQFPPSNPWVMLGMRRPEQTERSLSALTRRGIELVNDEVRSIDVNGGTVRTSGGEFHYDHLVIALGAEYAPGSIPGFGEHAHHIYDLESAVRAKGAVDGFKEGRIAVGVSRTPFKCPAAPYETALLLTHRFREGVSAGKVKVSFFTPEGLPLPSAGPEIGNATLEFMKSRGIEARFKVKLTEVRQQEAAFDDGSTMPFDLLLAVPPHVCPKPVADAGLTDQGGWVPVEPTTMKTKVGHVYAIGDVASVPTPSGYVPLLPKAGVFAQGQAEVVAHNIAVEITGQGTAKAFDGSGSCFLMTGGDQAAFVKGTWYAKPHPDIGFHQPSRTNYTERVLFERYWLSHWFRTNPFSQALDSPIEWAHRQMRR